MSLNLDEINSKECFDLSEEELVEKIGWCIVHLDKLGETIEGLGLGPNLEYISDEIEHYEERRDELLKIYNENFRCK